MYVGGDFILLIMDESAIQKEAINVLAAVNKLVSTVGKAEKLMLYYNTVYASERHLLFPWTQLASSSLSGCVFVHFFNEPESRNP